MPACPNRRPRAVPRWKNSTADFNHPKCAVPSPAPMPLPPPWRPPNVWRLKLTRKMPSATWRVILRGRVWRGMILAEAILRDLNRTPELVACADTATAEATSSAACAESRSPKRTHRWQRSPRRKNAVRRAPLRCIRILFSIPNLSPDKISNGGLEAALPRRTTTITTITTIIFQVGKLWVQECFRVPAPTRCATPTRCVQPPRFAAR